MNLELKVRCNEQEMQLIRHAAASHDIGPFVTLTHRDTYFHASRGRLKLREIHYLDQSEQVELISYSRPDAAEARWSHYTRAEIPLATAESIRLALVSSLGVTRIVDKVREVAIWRRTRIHLDDVNGIGLFAELETVTDSATDPAAAVELREAADLLGLAQLEVISGSYAEMPKLHTMT